MHTPLEPSNEAQPSSAASTPHNPLLSQQHGENVEALAGHVAQARLSRWQTLRSLSGAQRWKYFRDEFVWRILAVLTALLLVILLAVRIFSPAAQAQLYIAVVGVETTTAQVSALQQDIAQTLHLPEGQDNGVIVDASFNLSEGGLSKLQTLLRNAQVDVIIASPEDFATLAGYGYLTNLRQSLTSEQQTTLGSTFLTFPGFDDSQEEDPDYNGAGKGAEEAYGISLQSSALWSQIFTPASSTSAPLVGLAQDSSHTAQAQNFVDIITRN
ncbi:hypothetical protein [Alloscardovia criceti]|uniref:hypothetical protein n=1 Tax=Alloscardovia criceti TaxID=356828 RepID=UPI00035E851B|nr:hypothetical protein [Alloscardovia criceti]